LKRSKDGGCRAPTLHVLCVCLACGAAAAAEPPTVVVDRDNVEITADCTVRIDRPWIADADGDGVIHITGDGITVDFAGQALSGAESGPPDAFRGTGIRINARNVTLRGARISGFKAGIHARAADGLVVEDCDLSGNFRQRLRSTPQREDPADWLRPHANDDNEWLTLYGAGLYIEDSKEVKVRRVRAWGTQNGIVLDRVSGAQVYDNDCSFGSGWGLALWRSNDNVISRNAFDFRVRGYSHGVYNRGQDSAGILVFEQCGHNVITHNSATHGGDGLFGFAGSEALGEVKPKGNPLWYKNRGCNRNDIANNDLSYAAVHGLEMTFSYNNHIMENRLVGNGVCGIWAGYCRATYIFGNTSESNGDMPYGSQRGGINIEHGSRNGIKANSFRNNACGIFLWWDRDEEIMKLPWTRANTTAVELNSLRHNTFDGDEIGIQLRQTGPTRLVSNRMTNVGTEIDADERSGRFVDIQEADIRRSPIAAPHPIGRTNPVGARVHLRGREHIIMTEWGPYDWQEPLLTAPWDVLFFASAGDPREDPDAWRSQGEKDGVRCSVAALDLAYGKDGPGGLGLDAAVTAAGLPVDHFGTIATARVAVPVGRWRITTSSDDGIRVWIDDALIIDDWTHHAARTRAHELELTEPKQVTIRVEHFELEGAAVLSVALEPVTGTAPNGPEAPRSP
jgi:nitrous oxidase accessory protein NosD